MAKVFYFVSFLLLAIFSFLAGFLNEFKYGETLKVLSIVFFVIATILRFSVYKRLALVKRILFLIFLYSLGFVARPVLAYQKHSISNYVFYQMSPNLLVQFYRNYNFVQTYYHFTKEYLNEKALNQFYKNGNTKISKSNQEINVNALLTQNKKEYKPVILIKVSGDVESTLKDKVGLVLSSKISSTNRLFATNDEFKIGELNSEKKRHISDFLISIEIEVSTIDSGYRVRSFWQKAKEGTLLNSIYFFATNEDNLIKLFELLPYSLINRESFQWN